MKSLELMLAESIIPGENDNELDGRATCVEDVDLATVVVTNVVEVVVVMVVVG